MAVSIISADGSIAEYAVVNNAVIRGGNDYVMYIESGGTALNTKVSSGGYVSVYVGGINSNCHIYSGGMVKFLSGAYGKDVILDKGGQLYVSGTVDNLSWTPCEGELHIVEKGKVSFASSIDGVYYGASGSLLEKSGSFSKKNVSGKNVSMFIMDNGTASDISVGSSGKVFVFSGGRLSSGKISNSGNVTVSSGGTAEKISVSAGGVLTVSSGGSALNIDWTPCVGTVNAMAGAYITYVSKYSGVYFSSDGQSAENFMSVSGKTFSSGNIMYVMSGGTAENIMFNGGKIYVSSGGSISFAYNPFYTVSLQSAGGAKVTYLDRDADVYIGNKSGFVSKHKGTVSDVSVGKNQKMIVYEGGTAAKTYVASDGQVHVSSGGNMQSAVINGGKMYVSGGQVSSTTVSSGNMEVYGGTVSDTFVHSGGTVVISGGTAVNTKIDNGKFYVYGSASAVEVEKLAHLWVSSGGHVSDVLVDNADMTLAIGASAEKVNIISDGRLNVKKGAVVENAVASNGEIFIESGGSAEDISAVSSGIIHVSSGANISNISVSSGGRLNIVAAENTYAAGTVDGSAFTMSNGRVNSLKVNGMLSVSSGGIADNTTVASNGVVRISSGGMHRNELNIQKGGKVEVSDGGIIEFSLIGRSASAGYFINNAALISGAPSYTVNVALEQNAGKYKLAQGAKQFNSSVTIYCDGMNFGTVDVNNTLEFKGASYTLSRDGSGNLTLTVAGMADLIKPVLNGVPTAAVDGKNAVISWNEASDNVGVAGYFLTVNGITDTVNGTKHTFENLAAGTYTYSLQAYDAAGNISFSSAEMNFYIADYDAPILDGEVSAVVKGTGVTISWNEASDNVGVTGYILTVNGIDYYLEGTTRTFDDLAAGSYTCSLRAYDAANNISAVGAEAVFVIEKTVDEYTELQGSSEGVSWKTEIDGKVTVDIAKYSNADSGILRIETAADGIDFYGMPTDVYQWSVISPYNDCYNGNIINAVNSDEAEVFVSNADARTDLFFAVGKGIWNGNYMAEHCGNADWTGTKKRISLAGKNKIIDIFEGSASSNILVLSDDGNGDALFVDDIFSTAVVDGCSRITLIKEIRAGAGDDIIDMTSQRFEYVADNMTVYGGGGNDVIWANSGSNILFGDAGNDDITGGTGDDIIIGGCGDDILHGGGGTDTFVFGGNFGTDEIYQCANGKIILCFESEKVKYDEVSGSYTDGTNSVKIYGDDFEVIIGENISEELVDAGVFKDFVSSEIFEKINITA